MSNDRAVIRRAAETRKQDKARLDNAVNAMLEHPDTRYYLNWLLEIGMVGQQPFTANALSTSFNCGQLNIGNQILAHILEVNTAGYVRMRQEIEDERRTRSTDIYAESDDESGVSAPD